MKMPSEQKNALSKEISQTSIKKEKPTKSNNSLKSLSVIKINNKTKTLIKPEKVEKVEVKGIYPKIDEIISPLTKIFPDRKEFQTMLENLSGIKMGSSILQIVYGKKN